MDPWSNFSFQPVPHDWCNKGYGMYYPGCDMVNIKDSLLLIDIAYKVGQRVSSLPI